MGANFDLLIWDKGNTVIVGVGLVGHCVFVCKSFRFTVTEHFWVFCLSSLL